MDVVFGTDATVVVGLSNNGVAEVVTASFVVCVVVVVAAVVCLPDEGEVTTVVEGDAAEVIEEVFWGWGTPAADDTTGEGVFFVTVTVCPATAADGRVTEAVVTTNLVADTVVTVTAGLLLATELCVPCTTF